MGAASSCRDYGKQVCVEEVVKRTSQARWSSAQKWTDEDVQMVLSNAPTKANAEMLSSVMGRTIGSIEMVFRWAQQTHSTVNSQPKRQTFARRIKRLAKGMGWL